MKISKLLFLYAFVAISFNLTAQSPVGLWEVVKVSVGEDEMTPKGKWIQFQEDGGMVSGNGWLQNGAGTWSFDKKNSTLSPNDTLSPPDPFGPFSVKWNGSQMIWQRTEEDMDVTVYLKEIDNIPMSARDRIRGFWEISESTDSTLFPSGSTFFVRWDGLFVRQDKGGRTGGYWNMHGHRDELILIPYDETAPRQSWELTFINDKMVLTGKSAGIHEVVVKADRQH